MLIFVLSPSFARAQELGVMDEKSAQNLVWESKLQSQVEFYCDSSLFKGRATGTQGGVQASFSIIGKFKDLGLLPVSWSYNKSFMTQDSLRIGHNVVGMLPAAGKKWVDSYIIVGAHYDNLGILGGKFYPGADSNASGLVALTTIAEMFSTMGSLGKTYKSNIIFVAFDGNESNRAGSYDLWRRIEDGSLIDPVSRHRITKDKIRMMVNIDQLGSSLAPLRRGQDGFLIMLGGHSLPVDCRNLLSHCNRFYWVNLQLSETYYGSENFTKVFYTLSDQRVFVENNIPAVLFTSGITMNNNKTYDTPDTLNYPVFRKRIILIYYWLNKFI